MRSRMCPRCGKPYRGPSCPRCQAARRKGAPRTREAEAQRKQKNPWRTSYGSTEYRNARQVVIARQNGRCAITGEKVADWDGSKWVIRHGKGGVHHIVPLSSGGSAADPSNLVLLSTGVHNQIDAFRRRSEKQEGR